jgi:hypothetical protein
MALHCSIAAANRMATAVPLTAVLRELSGPQGAAFNPRRGSRYLRILRSRIPAEFQGIRWGDRVSYDQGLGRVRPAASAAFEVIKDASTRARDSLPRDRRRNHAIKYAGALSRWGAGRSAAGLLWFGH